MEREADLDGLERLANGALEVASVRRPIGRQRDAVAMARTVVDAALLPAVRRAGSDTVCAQSAEIDAMSSWLRGWCGAEPESATGEMAMPGVAIGRGAGPAAAEWAFLAGMLRRRGGAIGLGELALERATPPVRLGQAWAIMARQRSEQETFGCWLAPWCPDGAGAQVDAQDSRGGAANGDESARGAPRPVDGDGGGGV